MKELSEIRWGIIGCGDVCEVKSGPAFQKATQSDLVAVMRRDAAKAQNFALRHGVPVWYSQAKDLLSDDAVNAVYIATPPSTHFSYAAMALHAGKQVYLEKPMTRYYAEAIALEKICREPGTKLVVAHYRRAQPYFKKIGEIIHSGLLGDIRCINLRYYKPANTREELLVEKMKWRVDPAISGGGLFHDIAPHQLDILMMHFGYPVQVNGKVVNQSLLYEACDMVSASLTFSTNIVFQGLWCFNGSPSTDEDVCEIVGEKGTLRFNFFSQKPIILSTDKEEIFSFDYPQHVQEYMIQETVDYFLGKRDNPCPVVAGVDVMRLMEEITI